MSFGGPRLSIVYAGSTPFPSSSINVGLQRITPGAGSRAISEDEIEVVLDGLPPGVGEGGVVELDGVPIMGRWLAAGGPCSEWKIIKFWTTQEEEPGTGDPIRLKTKYHAILKCLDSIADNEGGGSGWVSQGGGGPGTGGSGGTTPKSSKEKWIEEKLEEIEWAEWCGSPGTDEDCCFERERLVKMLYWQLHSKFGVSNPELRACLEKQLSRLRIVCDNEHDARESDGQLDLEGVSGKFLSWLRDAQKSAVRARNSRDENARAEITIHPRRTPVDEIVAALLAMCSRPGLYWMVPDHLAIYEGDSDYLRRKFDCSYYRSMFENLAKRAGYSSAAEYYQWYCKEGGGAESFPIETSFFMINPCTGEIRWRLEGLDGKFDNDYIEGKQQITGYEEIAGAIKVPEHCFALERGGGMGDGHDTGLLFIRQEAFS